MTDKQIKYVNEQTVGAMKAKTTIKTNTVQQLKEILGLNVGTSNGVKLDS